MGREKISTTQDSSAGEKPSRMYVNKHSRDYHHRKPSDGSDDEKLGPRKLLRHGGKESVSPGKIADEIEATFGFQLEVGVCFTDASCPGEIFEITRVFGNGDIQVEQTSNENGRNYFVTRGLSRAWLENAIEDDDRGNKRLSLYELSTVDLAELAELAELGHRAIVESNQNGDQTTTANPDVSATPESSVVVPGDASGDGASEVPIPSVTANSNQSDRGQSNVILPKPGKIQGRQFGGITPSYDDPVSKKNPDEAAVDAQQSTGGRRRKGSSNTAKSQLSDKTGETPAQPPKPQEASGGQDIEVQPNPTDNNEADPMKFEQSPVADSRQDEVRSIVDVLGEDDLSKRTTSSEDQSPAVSQPSANNEDLVGFGRTYDEHGVQVDASIPAIVRTRDSPLHTVNQETQPQENDQYKDGSVWVQEYLNESDQQADLREPAPASIVRTRDNSLHTRFQPNAEQPEVVPIKELDDDEGKPASEEERADVYATFGRDPKGDRLITPERQLEQSIETATLTCDQARLEYVTADNESRTVMSRLKGVLGISGKDLQNETVEQKKKVYQEALRTLRDLRLEMVKIRHVDRIQTEAALRARAQESPESDDEGSSDEPIWKSFPDPEDENPLEKELEAELRHFATEVNIGLYNAWTELKSEQKGILGRLKQFGAAYNKLSWKKKLVIGIPVAGLAIASGAGLLGTAMASAAIAAVIARRGVAAAGMFAAADGGLQKLAESRAQKMAEKIVASEQQEVRLLENLDHGDLGEARSPGSEAPSSPEANEEPLDVRLERMKTFMDNHMIDSLDQTLESRVRGHDRRRLGSLAASMGVAFGLPSFLASETGHDLTHAAAVKAGAGVRVAGEAVFGNDFPLAKPEGTLGSTPSVSPDEATAGTKAAAPATIERGASGSTLESSTPANGVELGGKKIPDILGNKITLAKGDSVWKLAGNMAKELGVEGDAESLYVTDALKNAYIAKGGNPNIQAGAVFDWKKYLSAEDIQKALKGAESLSAEQKASIIANKGKVIASAVAGSSAPGNVTGAGLVEMAGVQTKHPDVLARARPDLAAEAGETTRVPANGTTVAVGRNLYHIDGVRPEQLANTTGLINIPGVGKIDIVELQSVEEKLQAYPTWSIRQLAEAARNPAQLPVGMTIDDVARMKRLIVGIPEVRTQEFIQKNGSIPVGRFIQDNLRARIPVSQNLVNA